MEGKGLAMALGERTRRLLESGEQTRKPLVWEEQTRKRRWAGAVLSHI